MATTAPPTAPLYQRDESLRTNKTSVLSVSTISALVELDQLLFKQAPEGAYVVTTEETIFYTQGGGQPSDTGTMFKSASAGEEGGITFNVLSVRNGSSKRILHLGVFEPADKTFSSGNVVDQAIDSAKREFNSRIHTAGYVVGLAVRHLAASILDIIELKAQHYPDTAFVDFQGTIDGQHKEAIQAKADEFVRQNLPIKVYWWEEKELREKCAVVPAAVAIPEGELVRAVDIEGAGAYPCGGTHVKATGQIGSVVIKKYQSIERKQQSLLHD